MEKISYAEFLRTIDGKGLTLVSSVFYDEKRTREIYLQAFEGGRLETVTPINSGIVTVRSNDFFRTIIGKGDSYAARIKGQEVYAYKKDEKTFFALLGKDNAIFYSLVD